MIVSRGGERRWPRVPKCREEILTSRSDDGLPRLQLVELVDLKALERENPGHTSSKAKLAAAGCE